MAARKKRQPAGESVFDLVQPYPVRFPNGRVHHVHRLDDESLRLLDELNRTRRLEDAQALWARMVPGASDVERSSLTTAQMGAVVSLALGRPDEAAVYLAREAPPVPFSLAGVPTSSQVM